MAFPSWLSALPAMSGPRYLAITECLAAAVQAGELRPGDRLPPHRDLAGTLSLNVSTVTRAYHEMQKRGLVQGETGRGTFIAPPHGHDGPFTLSHGTPAGNFVDLSHNFPPTAPVHGLPAISAAMEFSERELAGLLSGQADVGQAWHRDAGAQWLRGFGIEATPEDVILTGGGQHGLMLAIAAQTRPGEPVLTEELGYYGLKSTAAMLGRPLVPVRMDAEGLMPDYLELACRRSGARTLVCTPTLHNPTTATMSLVRRQEVLEVCQRLGVTIIEDDVYGFLIEPSLPSFAALAPGRTIHVTSISKIVGPGWRLGYLKAPRPMQEALGIALRATTLMASSLAGEGISRLIASGALSGISARVRQEIAWRQRVAAGIFNGLRVRQHPAAFHLWMRLPVGWTAEEFTRRAAQRGVGVAPSPLFEMGRAAEDQAVRICVNAAPSVERLSEALGILRDLARLPRLA
ncbi:aminotransferase-like domain-containing protein [Rhodovarius crocodyli]|nr:PLP-dependent aminotransferase family protein [Rhodovarius crocodyli]